MEKSLVKFEEQLKEYRETWKYNVLVPTSTIQEISPFHKPVLEIVNIGDAKSGDVYEPVYWSGNFALHATALQKIGYAAGLIWNAKGCMRTDNGNDPNIISYKAEAAVRKDDGTYMLLNAEYMMDLTVIDEELRDTYDKKFTNLVKEGKQRETNRKDYIEKNVKRDLLQKRKFRLEMVQAEVMAEVEIQLHLAQLNGVLSSPSLSPPFTWIQFYKRERVSLTHLLMENLSVKCTSPAPISYCL